MAAFAFRVGGGGKAFERGDARSFAFKGVDLDVGSSEILVLLGPSGCGKSTLLRAIAGLETFDEGGVEFRADLRAGNAVGIAFQQPSLLPWLTVAGNVGLGLRFAANKGAGSDDVIGRTIDELGLSEVADAFPDELSGGQAQRTNVARLVVAGRPILLLDEPFAALDPVTRAGLQDWLLELQRVHELSLVLVTHDVSEALRLGDRITLMSGAPGSIKRTWDVPERDGHGGAATAIQALRDEILDHYDLDVSAPATPPDAWFASGDILELEGEAR